MDVHRPTSLELRDLGVGDADLRTQRSDAKSAQGRELAGQVRDCPTPEGSKARVPASCFLVVVAVRTERLADPRIALGMALGAAHRDAVFAFLRFTTDPAAAHATSIDHAAMNRPERWCGERREDERVRGNVSRDTFLFAPGQPGGDEEIGVTAIAFRAGRTARLPPVATGDEHEARSLRPRGPAGEQLPCPWLEGDRLAFEADRRGAAAGSGGSTRRRPLRRRRRGA